MCFKSPDGASSAKNANLQINGAPLFINHYEIKEQRDLNLEAETDKKDF